MLAEAPLTLQGDEMRGTSRGSSLSFIPKRSFPTQHFSHPEEVAADRGAVSAVRDGACWSFDLLCYRNKSAAGSLPCSSNA